MQRIFGIVFCLCVLGAGCSRGPVSSSTALRNTNDYVTAVQGAAIGPLDAAAFDHISTSESENELIFEYQSAGTASKSDGFAHVRERLKPGEGLKGEGAMFELVALGIAMPTNTMRIESRSVDVPLEFFAPDGRRLADAELESIGLTKWELSTPFYPYEDNFPKLHFLFGSRTNPPGHYSMVGLFDARTKRRLAFDSGYSQIGAGHLGQLNVQCEVWHPVPMDLVLDVQLDGRVVVETNMVAGTTISVPGGMVRVLGVWNGAGAGISGRGQGNGMPARTDILLNTHGQENASMFVFACEPPGLAVHVDCLDANGKALATAGGGGGGAIHSLGLRAKVAEVKQVRLTIFTNHHEVVIPLPPIPGLPQENQRAANLFAVHVPSVHFEREYQLRGFIGDATQMSFSFALPGDIMPTNNFPFFRTNTTPARLLSEYGRYLPRGYQVTVDQKKQEIRVEQTALEIVTTWLKQHLRL